MASESSDAVLPPLPLLPLMEKHEEVAEAVEEKKIVEASAPWHAGLADDLQRTTDSAIRSARDFRESFTWQV